MGLFFVFFLIFIALNLIGYSLWCGITPTPTSGKVKKVVLSLLPPLEGDIFILGSGWGNIAFALASHYPQCQIKAYEVSWIPYLYSFFLQKIYGYPQLTLSRVDFFTVSLQSAKLCFCYLYPTAMQKLKIKWEKEAKSGAYFLTHTFTLPKNKPLKIQYATDLYQTPVYLYQKQ